MSSAELAQEFPFSDSFGVEPWDTPTERAETIRKTFKREIRRQTTDPAKKRAESLAKKAAERKATDFAKREVKKLAKKALD